jgi:hypothetical protein
VTGSNSIHVNNGLTVDEKIIDHFKKKDSSPIPMPAGYYGNDYLLERHFCSEKEIPRQMCADYIGTISPDEGGSDASGANKKMDKATKWYNELAEKIKGASNSNTKLSSKKINIKTRADPKKLK